MKGTSRLANFIFLVLLLTPYFYVYPQTEIIELNKGWKFSQVSVSTHWYPATVPGCVHSDLYKNKLIDDPFYRDNEKKLQWIEKEAWDYVDTILIDSTILKNDHIELVFESLDTRCGVFINWKFAGYNQSMFYPFIIDCKELFIKGKNIIYICFHKQSATSRHLYNKYKYPLPDDDRVMVRKAQFQYGWDWAPRFVSCGIAKPVYIRTWNKARIESVQYNQKKLSQNEAQLSATIEIVSDIDFTGTIEITDCSLEGESVTEDDYTKLAKKKVKLHKGLNKTEIDFNIAKPVFWWPIGYQEYCCPALYKIVTTLSQKERVIDGYCDKIGLRTVELVREPDSFGQSFYFKINGQPIFIKGANYIPSETFSGSNIYDPGIYNKLRRLMDAAESGANMIRVWGGGIYEDDYFYNRCDELGLLVWQDFMFSCGMYPDDTSFINQVKKEADYQIKRLRNHPCLALWCGNNEIDEGWKNWGWQKKYHYSAKDSVEIWHNYLKIFDTILPNSIRKYDPKTSYIPSSPQIGWGRPESMKEGDSHYWGIWWGEQPFETYKEKTGRFMSEYGFQGIPDLKTIKIFTGGNEQIFDTAMMKAHQKHPKGYELIDKYMNWYYKPPKDFSSYVYVSQLLQAYGMKIAIEAHRRAKPYCMGTLYWQLNDCWPVTSWSGIDYYGNFKAFQFHLTDLYDKFLLSADEKNGLLNIYVVSDSLAKFEGKLNLQLLDFDGKILWETQKNILITANSSAICFSIDTATLLKNCLKNKVVLVMELWKGNEKLKTDLYYFSLPKNLALEEADISFEFYDKCFFPSCIELKSNKLAKNVFIWTDNKDVVFLDNYIDILPGRTVQIKYLGKMETDNLQPVIHFKSLLDCY